MFKYICCAQGILDCIQDQQVLKLLFCQANNHAGRITFQVYLINSGRYTRGIKVVYNGPEENDADPFN